MKPLGGPGASVTLVSDMQFSVLGSGSKGNSVFIESGRTSVLIDAGFSGKQISSRLSLIGKDVEEVSAILLTHEHNDHVSGAGVLSRRCRIPVFANEGTFRGAAKKIGKLHRREEFATGDTVAYQDLQIRSFRISHDTLDPVGYVISDGMFSIGYCTDTGKVSHLMAARLRKCNVLILEFNHDPHMLKMGPYPLALQQRVRSSQGHLANEDAAEFLGQLQHDKLQYVVLAHLSETNNLPELAQKAAAKVNGSHAYRVMTAGQKCPTPIVSLLHNS